MDSPTGMVDLPAGWEKATHKGRTSGEGTVAAFQQGRVNESHPSSAGPLAKMINFNQALIGHTRPNRDKRLWAQVLLRIGKRLIKIVHSGLQFAKARHRLCCIKRCVCSSRINLQQTRRHHRHEPKRDKRLRCCSSLAQLCECELTND
jgi:hypothetical protein